MLKIILHLIWFQKSLTAQMDLKNFLQAQIQEGNNKDYQPLRQ